MFSSGVGYWPSLKHYTRHSFPDLCDVSRKGQHDKSQNNKTQHNVTQYNKTQASVVAPAVSPCGKSLDLHLEAVVVLPVLIEVGADLPKFPNCAVLLLDASLKFDLVTPLLNFFSSLLLLRQNKLKCLPLTGLSKICWQGRSLPKQVLNSRVDSCPYSQTTD